MNDSFYTLYDFLWHTEAVTYVLMIGTLIGIAGFWRFLSQRDEDE